MVRKDILIVIVKRGVLIMENEKKTFVDPQFTVVKFDSDIVMQTSPEECIEMHSWTSGSDCHEQEMYLQQGD